MSCCKYLELPDRRRIPMMRKNKCGNTQTPPKPIFCQQFIQLWELLYNTGLGNAPTFSGIVDKFPLPNKSSSRLNGFPAIVDPSSPVRLYSFFNEDVDGPIENHGFSLQTYNDEVFYKIKWKVEEDLDDFIIGFYRSDGFVDQSTNTFSLICGSHGASIFRRSCGSFISPGISNLFVAANKDTKIKLKVKVVIPNKIVYPDITLCQPYTKYITLKDCDCKEIQLPAYKIFLFDNTSIIKEPSRYFVEATATIKKYLKQTGLSITLLPDNLPKPLYSFPNCYDCLNGCGPQIINTIEYNPIPRSGSASTTTKPISVCDPEYFIAGIPRGIRLNTPTNKVAKVTFKISTNTFVMNSYDLEYRVQYRSGGIYYTHNKLDANGIIDGTAEDTINIQPDSEGHTITKSYKLPQTSIAFAITVYFTITTNSSPDSKGKDINSLVQHLTFDLVKIEYVDPISPID